MTIKEKSLKKHYEWKGKIETKVKAKLKTKEDLMLAYTPGVAEACLAIKNDVSLSYQLTGRGNTIAVITDGTAVLGLGDIGPEAGMPVMEGKAALFNRFGDVNVVPLCLKTKDTEEIIKTIKLLEGNFAGINLEDIAAPRCFEIEKRLVEELDIPVFHDDQHGTAIVVGAALINSLRLTKKKLQAINIVINGAGAAGIAIAKFLLHLGAKNLILVDKNGIISRDEPQSNKAKEEIALLTNHHLLKGILVEAIKGADVFIGVSVPNVLTKEMVKSMAKDPIVFPLANPIPEIDPKLAKQGGAIIVGTGSNQYPNQINNALVFPGLFKGALAAGAKKITIEMMASASEAIAYYITDEKLTHDYIVPSVLNEEVHQKVSESVRITAIKQEIIRK